MWQKRERLSYLKPRREGPGIPLLFWFNVKEPQLPPLLGREASGFLFLFLLLPVSEVLQNDGLALQEVLPDLLAHVGHAPFQEGPHEGLGPLGARVLCRNKMAWGSLLWLGPPRPPGPPAHAATADEPPLLTHHLPSRAHTVSLVCRFTTPAGQMHVSHSNANA